MEVVFPSVTTPQLTKARDDAQKVAQGSCAKLSPTSEELSQLERTVSATS